MNAVPTPAELYADHAARPRNLGKLLNAAAVGDVGSIVVGDALRFYIQVADERITAAKFQVFNAADQLAAASVVTELAVGKTLDEALALTAVEACAHLQGLAYTALPPQPWGLAGLRAAVAMFRAEDLPADDDHTDALLCRCFGISEDTVRQSIAVLKLTDVDSVVAATGAGSGCGTCRADIPRLLDEAQGKTAAKPAAKTATAGRIQTINRIRALYDERIAPAATAAGGRLELWDLRDGQVLIRARDGLATEAARELLGDFERLLRAEIDPTLSLHLEA